MWRPIVQWAAEVWGLSITRFPGHVGHIAKISLPRRVSWGGWEHAMGRAAGSRRGRRVEEAGPSEARRGSL